MVDAIYGRGLFEVSRAESLLLGVLLGVLPPPHAVRIVVAMAIAAVVVVMVLSMIPLILVFETSRCMDHDLIHRSAVARHALHVTLG